MAKCLNIPTVILLSLFMAVFLCVGSEVNADWSKNFEEIEGKSLECLKEF